MEHALQALLALVLQYDGTASGMRIMPLVGGRYVVDFNMTMDDGIVASITGRGDCLSDAFREAESKAQTVIRLVSLIND